MNSTNDLQLSIEKMETVVSILEHALISNDSKLHSTIKTVIDDSVFVNASITSDIPYVTDTIKITTENREEIQQRLYDVPDNPKLKIGDTVVFYSNTTPTIIPDIEKEVQRRSIINTINVSIDNTGKITVDSLVPNCSLDTTVEPSMSSTAPFRPFTLSWVDSFVQRDILKNNRLFILNWVDEFEQPPYEHIDPIPVDRCFLFEWGDLFEQPDYRQIEFNDGDVIINEICIPCLLEDRTFGFEWEDFFPQNIPETELNGPLEPRAFGFEWLDSNPFEEMVNDGGGEVPTPAMGSRGFEVILMENSPPQEVIRNISNAGGLRLSNRNFILTVSDHKPLETFSNGDHNGGTSQFDPSLSVRNFIVQLGIHSKSISGNGNECSICLLKNDDDGDSKFPSWENENEENDINEFNEEIDPDDIINPEDLPEEIPEDELNPVDGKPDLELTITCDVFEPFLGIGQGMGLPPLTVEMPTITKECDTGIFNTNITDDGYLVVNFTECGDTPHVIGKVRPDEAIDGKTIVFFQVKDGDLYSTVTTKHGIYTDDVAEEVLIGRLEYPEIEAGYLSSSGNLVFTNSQRNTLTTSANLMKSVKNGMLGIVPTASISQDNGTITLEIGENGRNLLTTPITVPSEADVYINKKSNISIDVGETSVEIIPTSGVNKDITNVRLIGDTLYLERAYTDVFSAKAISTFDSMSYNNEMLHVSINGSTLSSPLDISNGINGNIITDITSDNRQIVFKTTELDYLIAINKDIITFINAVDGVDDATHLEFLNGSDTLQEITISDFNGSTGAMLSSINSSDNEYVFKLDNDDEFTIPSPDSDYIKSISTTVLDNFNVSIEVTNQDDTTSTIHERYNLNASDGKMLTSIVSEGTVNEYYTFNYSDSTMTNIFVGPTTGIDGVIIENILLDNDTLNITLSTGDISSFSIPQYNGKTAVFPVDLYLNDDGMYYETDVGVELITRDISDIPPISRIPTDMSVDGDSVYFAFNYDTPEMVATIENLSPSKPGIPTRLMTDLTGKIDLVLDNSEQFSTVVSDFHGANANSIKNITDTDIVLNNDLIFNIGDKNGKSFKSVDSINVDSNGETVSFSIDGGSTNGIISNTYLNGINSTVVLTAEKTDNLVFNTNDGTKDLGVVDGIDSNISIMGIVQTLNGIEQTATNEVSTFDELFLNIDNITKTSNGMLVVSKNHSLFSDNIGYIDGVDVADGKWVTSFSIENGNLSAILSDGSDYVIAPYTRPVITNFSYIDDDLILTLSDGNTIDIEKSKGSDSLRTMVSPFSYMNEDGKLVYTFNDGDVITTASVKGDNSDTHVTAMMVDGNYQVVTTMNNSYDIISNTPFNLNFGFEPYESKLYHTNDTVSHDGKLYLSITNSHNTSPSSLSNWTRLLMEDDSVDLYGTPEWSSEAYDPSISLLYNSKVDASINVTGVTIEYQTDTGILETRHIDGSFIGIVSNLNDGDSITMRISETISPTINSEWSTSKIFTVNKPNSNTIGVIDSNSLIPQFDNVVSGNFLVDNGYTIKLISVNELSQLGTLEYQSVYTMYNIDDSKIPSNVLEVNTNFINIEHLTPTLISSNGTIVNTDSFNQYFNDICFSNIITFEWILFNAVDELIIYKRMGDSINVNEYTGWNIKGRYVLGDKVSEWSNTLSIATSESTPMDSIELETLDDVIKMSTEYGMVIDDQESRRTVLFNETIPRGNENITLNVQTFNDDGIFSEWEEIVIPAIDNTILLPPRVTGYFSLDYPIYMIDDVAQEITNVQFETSNSIDFSTIFKTFDYTISSKNFQVTYSNFVDGEVYYLRARIAYGDEWSGWSNVEQFGYKMFTSPGEYMYELPIEVSKFSTVAIGAGSGNPSDLYSGYSAYGGSLRYIGTIQKEDLMTSQLSINVGNRGGTNGNGGHSIVSNLLCAMGGHFRSTSEPPPSFVNTNISSTGWGGGNGYPGSYNSSGSAGGYFTDGSKSRSSGESGTQFNNTLAGSSRAVGGGVGIFGSYINTGRSVATLKHGSYPYGMPVGGVSSGAVCFLFGIAKYPEGLVSAWNGNE